MKSLEIICCLFILIFALAVAHPLADNVLEQEEAKEDPTAAPVLPGDPTVAALELNDPTNAPILLNDPTAAPVLSGDPTEAALEPNDILNPALPLKDPTAAPVLPGDPTESAFELNDPTNTPILLKDPAAAAAPDLPQLPNDGNAPPPDTSQDGLQEQQNPEAIAFSEEALEAILNDASELQKEE